MTRLHAQRVERGAGLLCPSNIGAVLSEMSRLAICCSVAPEERIAATSCLAATECSTKAHPRALAAAIASRVRDPMRRRSYCATAASTAGGHLASVGGQVEALGVIDEAQPGLAAGRSPALQG